MKLENQVCTVEQSQKLESLGVKPESIMYHHFGSGMKWQILPEGFFYEHEEGVEFYPAFTVAEIRQAIGIGFTVVQTGYVSGTKVGNLYSVIKDAHFPNKPGHYPDAPEVGWEYLHSIGWLGDDQPIQDGEAHGALLIWLLENNHVAIEDVNKRLQSA